MRLMKPRPCASLAVLLSLASPAFGQVSVQVPVAPLGGAIGASGAVGAAPIASALGAPGPALGLPARLIQAGSLTKTAMGLPRMDSRGLAGSRRAVAVAGERLAAAGSDWGKIFDGGSGKGGAPDGGAPRRDIVEIRELPANGGQHASAAIYRQSRWQALRVPTVQDSDFEDVYAVRTTIDPSRLAAFADVLSGIRGEFAIVRVPEARLKDFVDRLHETGPHHGALVRLTGERLAPAAAAPAPAIPIEQTVALAQEAAALVDPAKIEAGVSELAAIHTRWYKSQTGKGVAEGLAKHYRRLAAGRADVSVIVDDHGGKLPQPSLIVRIKGRARPDEIVVLGSHIDSTARDRAPGADDDGSGTAVNLEIFRALMERGAAFDRTVEIHGYAAEEAGLLGSQDLARRYARAGKKVVAMLQNDMNLWKRAGTPDKIWFVTDDTTPQLNSMLASLASRYAGVPTGQGRLWGGTSDHNSWNRNGYATAFPFEDPDDSNPNIHSERDTIEGLSFSQAAAFAKLGIAFAAHFGGALAAKPVVNPRRSS